LAEIQGEIERSLEFLAAPLRDLPPRQRSMHAVFDHSWNLLSEHERRILRRLSVFRGGCKREAAQEVADASLADLAALVDSSWLRLGDNGRYGMHELMRQYCGEKLESEHLDACGETPAQVRRRHCTYYGAHLHEVLQKTNTRRQALQEIMAEFGNVQAAWHSAVDTLDVAVAFDICMILFFAGDLMGRNHFSIQIMESAAVRLEERLARNDLERADEAAIVQIQANIRHAQAVQYGNLGLLEEANRATERLGVLVERMEPGESYTFWHALHHKIQVLLSLQYGDWSDACRRARDQLVLYEDEGFHSPVYGEHGRVFWQAEIYAWLGRIHSALGDYAEAEQMFEQCLILRDKMGEKRVKAWELGFYSRLAQTLGNYSRAMELASQGLLLSEEVGDRVTTAYDHLAVGRVLAAQGRHDRARMHVEQSLKMGRQTGYLFLLMDPLLELACIELATGHPDAAKRLYEEALQAFAASGTAHTNSLVAVWLGLGWTALAQEKIAEAREMFGKALSARGRAAVETMDGIAGMGRVLMEEGKHEKAAEFFALVAHHRFTAYVLRQQAEEWLQRLECKLPAQTYNGRVAAGRHAKVDEVVDTLVIRPSEGGD
jgi:tetratricopeptide (TPR) repeat protein